MNIREAMDIVGGEPDPAKENVIRAAAQRLGFRTLETGNSDALDFRDVGIASLREVLDQVYEAGLRPKLCELPTG